MKKSARLAAAVVAVLVASLWTAAAGAQVPARYPGKAASPKTERYAVVQIGDETRVVRQSELSSLQKSVEETYRRDLKAYQEAKKTAGKNKDTADGFAKPVKNTVKALKKSLKSMEDAEAWREKFLEEKEGKSKSKSKVY